MDISSAVRKAWGFFEEKPKSHRELEIRFYQFLAYLRNEPHIRPVSLEMWLQYNIDIERGVRKKGIFTGAAMIAVGLGISGADSYLNLGISQYTKHIPEGIIGLAGLVHGVRDYCCYLDLADYKKEMDSAIEKINGPVRIR